jgi:type I restriction enzyme, S subunit
MDTSSNNLVGDLGEIPEGWRWCRLTDLVDRSRGICYGIVQPGKHDSSGTPMINSKDIVSGVAPKDIEFRVSNDIHRQYKRSTIQGGEILLTLVGANFGQVGIAPVEMVGYNCSRAVAVIPISESPLYISLCLRGSLCRRFMDNWANTTAQPTFNLKDVEKLPIPIPPINERNAIAHILGTLDDKIELNRKTNETLEAIAKALFKSWFVDFDPVRAKVEGRPTGLPAEISDLFPDSFEDSELGQIPIGWRVMELGMVSTFLNGYAFKSSDWQDHGVPVVKIGSVKPGFVDVDNVSFVSDEISASKDRYRLSPGDILIGMTGYVGEVGLVPISESPPLLNQRVGRVAPMSDAIVSRSFLYNWMRTSTFKDSVEVLSHGSAQANVSSDSIQSIPHAIPSSDIERAFASICEPILDRLLKGHREQKLLANIRDALLPKLISGEILIPDAEKMLEEVGT